VNIFDFTGQGGRGKSRKVFILAFAMAGFLNGQVLGAVNLVAGGTSPVLLQSNSNGVNLTNNEVINQQVSYAGNIPGLLKPVSNFSIGFDLSGAPGGTGPIGNNMNQIYHPLINLDEMRSGAMVAGYVIKTNGIQLGLTTKDTNYGYTTRNTTSFASTNS